MVVISRQLPRSNPTRRAAIAVGFFKLNNPGAAGVAITPATALRLTNMESDYDAAWTLIAQREAEQAAAIVAKNAGLEPLRLLCKHFIGVFNYGVERGKYPAGDRTYFHIDANDSNLPDLSTELEVVTLAGEINGNDPLRVAAGGAAMANPSTAEVSAALAAFQPLLAAADLAKEALDMAQEALEALDVEADKVIKKVWDEVETYFNEEEPASMRDNARQWGVVYITRGAPAILSGLVKNAGGTGIEGATVVIDETGGSATTNHEGRFTLSTVVVGGIHITASFPAMNNVTIEFEIPEHEAGVELEVPDITLS